MLSTTTPSMLLSNNSEIDAKLLNDKLAGISARRRRSSPLFSLHDAGALGSAAPSSGLNSIGLPPGGSRLRGFIKQLPVIGPLAVGVYRRSRGMTAPGMSWKKRIRQIPLVGSVLVWMTSIARLNAIRHRIALDMDHLRYRQDALDLNTQTALGKIDARMALLDSRLAAFDVKIGKRLAEFEPRFSGHDRRIKDIEALQIGPRLATFDTVDIAARLRSAEQFRTDSEVANIERDNRLANMTRELRRMIDAAVATRGPAHAGSGASARRSDAPDPIEIVENDSFYIDFEDKFRGTREDIHGRLAVYLPYIDRFIGDDAAHVVDVGCGRGEWLELLTEHGIKATGVDMNVAMVDTCHELGLEAICMDAIAYLRQQPEGSLAAVTGFHIIEHLPFNILLNLFDAALRALRPDGLIIFETPNPENLMVGACNFYYDPTHLSPIVPVVAEFMARQRGFAKAEILRLHPYPDSYHIAEDSETAKRVNDALYGPQDYAVLAWKTHAN